MPRNLGDIHNNHPRSTEPGPAESIYSRNMASISIYLSYSKHAEDRLKDKVTIDNLFVRGAATP